MQGIFTMFFHVIVVILSISLNRRKEVKQDFKLFIALMIGGFVWSQLQTEYLILRIKKNTERTIQNLL
ncbi:hypothetical protein [Niallia sp. NCCP-28]|uniref:hypothetical protein n=1 Tax=Niallia sp. NCCP-28 TaxID=2934712 RepID=UPI0020841634|nr:hypothetical protein [Niallia sp. NCCP-28]GKU82946.1 hypothetical protein NCCP28_23420 [Niallia sp. NCCP-28]